MRSQLGWGVIPLLVLGAHELPTDGGFRDRVTYHARIQALQWLTESIGRRRDPELHPSWLRNALSLDSAS
jgi:hypothetical protein